MSPIMSLVLWFSARCGVSRRLSPQLAEQRTWSRQSKGDPNDARAKAFEAAGMRRSFARIKIRH